MKKMSLALYRRCFKELKSKATELDCKITIRRYPKIKSRIAGFYKVDSNEIFILVYGKRPRKTSMIHTLAHEVRHALHVKLGLFSDYYNLTHYQVFDDILKSLLVFPRGYKFPDLKIAYAAELDCDKYGVKYLKSKGISFKCPKYPYSRTVASRMREEYFWRLKEILHY